MTDLGWGARLRALQPSPMRGTRDVVTAAVDVLAAWDWAVRPC